MKSAHVLCLAWILLRLTVPGAAAEPAIAPPSGLPERWLPVDDAGWTAFRESADSRLVYVSSSAGDDETARVYAPCDVAVGDDPFQPAGSVQPFRTLEAALEHARDGHPDWVLLKRGDVWRETKVSLRGGRSAAEPSLVGAYGPGAERASIQGRTAQVRIGGPKSGVCHAAIVSVELYCDFVDPASPNYGVDETTDDREKNKTHAGMGIFCGKWGPMENVLVEDCLLRFCSMSCVDFGSKMTNVVFRRNLVLDHYPVHGHTMGLWGSRCSILLEENILDHNGWLLQRSEANRGKPGQAIPLSHNTYYCDCHNTVFRNNIFLRAASIGNKWTANHGPGSVHDVLIDNNLYIDGEIGISMGGNNPAPLRWKNVAIVNNVMLDLGRSRPTGRSLAWYLDATDWDGGLIANNLFAHQPREEIGNTYAIHVGSIDAKGSYHGKGVHCRDLLVRDNVVHGLRSGRAVLVAAGGPKFQRIVFADNLFQLPGLDQPMADIGDLSGLEFRANTYYSDGEGEAFFEVGPRGDEDELAFEQWARRADEPNARFRRMEFPDASRSIETYMKSLGKEPSIDAFIAETRRQSKTNWREEFTAGAVNDWMREGFGVQRESLK